MGEETFAAIKMLEKVFGDFRGREMAAGVQATGIGDDWQTERAYLNMEAR